MNLFQASLPLFVALLFVAVWPSLAQNQSEPIKIIQQQPQGICQQEAVNLESFIVRDTLLYEKELYLITDKWLVYRVPLTNMKTPEKMILGNIPPLPIDKQWPVLANFTHSLLEKFPYANLYPDPVKNNLYFNLPPMMCLPYNLKSGKILPLVNYKRDTKPPMTLKHTTSKFMTTKLGKKFTTTTKPGNKTAVHNIPEIVSFESVEKEIGNKSIIAGEGSVFYLVYGDTAKNGTKYEMVEVGVNYTMAKAGKGGKFVLTPKHRYYLYYVTKRSDPSFRGRIAFTRKVLGPHSNSPYGNKSDYYMVPLDDWIGLPTGFIYNRYFTLFDKGFIYQFSSKPVIDSKNSSSVVYLDAELFYVSPTNYFDCAKQQDGEMANTLYPANGNEQRLFSENVDNFQDLVSSSSEHAHALNIPALAGGGAIGIIALVVIALLYFNKVGPFADNNNQNGGASSAAGGPASSMPSHNNNNNNSSANQGSSSAMHNQQSSNKSQVKSQIKSQIKSSVTNSQIKSQIKSSVTKSQIKSQIKSSVAQKSQVKSQVKSQMKSQVKSQMKSQVKSQTHGNNNKSQNKSQVKRS